MSFVASFNGGPAPSGTTFSSAQTINVTVNDLVVVGVNTPDGVVGLTITDTAGNTYTASPDNGAAITGSIDGWIFYSKITIANAANSIKASTASSQIVGSTMCGVQFRGINGSLDVHGTATESTNVTSHSAGSLNTISTDTIVAFNAEDLASGIQTYTQGSGWTIPANGKNTNANTSATSMLQYRTGAAPGNYSNTSTTGSASRFIGMLLAFVEGTQDPLLSQACL